MLLAWLSAVQSPKADEGFWPVAPPLKPEYCVRVVDVDGYGSGGVVSSRGLILTNRHVIAGQLERLSFAIARSGYRALDPSAEKPCPDLRIYSPLEDGQEQPAQPGIRQEYSEVRHCWSRYKVYSDVRLVYAPRQATLLEPWQSLYPRQNMDLDAAFLRIYENGQPLASPQHLAWQERQPQPGERVLAAGFPGDTMRWIDPKTRAYLRQTSWPLREAKWLRRQHLLNNYARQGAKQKFDSQDQRRQTSYVLRSLRQTRLYWRSRKLPNPGEGPGKVSVWTDPGQSRLAEWALLLVDRSGELFAGRDREQLLENHLEVRPELEELLLAEALRDSLERLGPEDAYVKASLAAEQPAHRLINGTQLADRDTRLRLRAHPSDILKSQDPLLLWARRVYPVILARKLRDRQWWRSRLRLAAPYPDADTTLRMVKGSICEAELLTPLTTDCDATGGLSGSPLVDAQGRLLGVVARQSDAISTQVYRVNGRATGVPCSSIGAGLKADGMKWLLQELLGTELIPTAPWLQPGNHSTSPASID